MAQGQTKTPTKQRASATGQTRTPKPTKKASANENNNPPTVRKSAGRPSKKTTPAVASQHVPTTPVPSMVDSAPAPAPGPGRPDERNALAPVGNGTRELQLEAEIERLRAENLQYKEKHTSRESTIIEIKRPAGEAGSRKGFVLQKAMEMEDDHETYLAILKQVRYNIIRAGLDVDLKYGAQDPAKMGQIFKLTRKHFPVHLARGRFKNDWPLADMVKQYLRNQRKEIKRKRKLAAAQPEEDDDSGTQEDEEDEDEDGPAQKKMRHINMMGSDEE